MVTLVAVSALRAGRLLLGGTSPGTGSTSSGSGSTGGSTTAAFDAANGQIFNPSTKTGGIITMADEGEPDSTDPGDSYYGYTWDLMRLYGRGLVMFNIAPGDGSTSSPATSRRISARRPTTPRRGPTRSRTA